MQQAIILASFGSIDPIVRARTINALAQDIQLNFANFDIRQAYTSNFIRKKLQNKGLNIPSIEEEISKLQSKQYTKVIILPTHLTPGEEFENKILPFASNNVEIIPPLFSLNCDTDFDKEAFEVILSCFNTYEDEQLLLIGHGSPHRHNPIYENLQHLADTQNLRVHIGVIEDSDTPNFDDVIKRLQKNNASKVLLAPMLFNGGSHINNDIAGDNEDSWKSRLTTMGYKIRVCVDGLGSFEQFRRLYIKRLQSHLIKNFQKISNVS